MTFTPQELVAVNAMQKLAREYIENPRNISLHTFLAKYKLPEPESCRDCATNRDAIKHNYPCAPCSKHPTSEPEKKQWVPERFGTYFTPTFHGINFVSRCCWYGDKSDRVLLKSDRVLLERGLVCQTEDEAREMALKMLAAIKK